jgi:gluconokinase
MPEALFIGIDIGTTGIRAAVFDLDGKQKGYCYQEYPLISNAEGIAELDPETIFQSFIKVTKNAIAQNNLSGGAIEGIGISAQMHSLLTVDKEGKCLTNVMTWADSRSILDADHIGENLDFRTLYQKTGCRVQHPIYPLSKLLWLQRCKPETFEETYKFVSIKEYILFRLYGEYVIDITDASTTGCFNIHKFDWDDDILKDILKVSREKFGEAVECTYILKGMKNEYAQAIGLRATVPMVIGSGDGIMANLGCGGIDNTTMSCTIGTSGALRIAVDKPLLDDCQRTWCYCFTKDQWVAGGAVNNGGIVLKWIRDQYREQFDKDVAVYKVKNVYQLFDKYIDEVQPGSNGLLFLPYLTGERSPGWHTDASAYICGIKITHDKRHFIRAAMEGVLYNMYSILEIIESIGGNTKRIIANGGYINSQIWLQMQADIFNREILVSPIGEASAWGAAYTAMVAVGAKKGFNEISHQCHFSKVIQPKAENHVIYQDSYQKYKELYNMLIEKKSN